MSNTVYLTRDQVPAHLLGDYAGKRLKALVTERVAIPANAGLWIAGTREIYFGVQLASGERVAGAFQSEAPWSRNRAAVNVPLQPGLAIIEHTTFCGTDMGLTFYLHPADAAPLLPAGTVLTEHERIVLTATFRFKPSYGGRDRYQMAMDEARARAEGYPDQPPGFPTRDEWATAKTALIARKLLNKAGAITAGGRNAIEGTR